MIFYQKTVHRVQSTQYRAQRTDAPASIHGGIGAKHNKTNKKNVEQKTNAGQKRFGKKKKYEKKRKSRKKKKKLQKYDKY